MMTIQEIKAYLPHRYPFLLVDRVMEIKVGKAITGYKNVTGNEAFFEGHFPDNPVMPGLLIVEALAQISGILGFKSTNKKPADGFTYYLAACNDTRFRRPVIPGDQLNLNAELIVEKRGVAKFNCTATVMEEVACSSIITCVEKPLDYA